MTAMSLLVYELTGKAADVGITLFCQFLPMLLLGVWAGAVADRHDNRTMTLLTQGLLALQALTLGGLYLLDLVNLPVVYVLSLVLGVVGAFDNPARRGFVLELVEPEEITNAISLNTAVMTGSRIVGPALAAALKGPLGAGWLFVINGVSFVALLWPLLAIDRSKLRPAPPAKRGGTPVRDSVRFIAPIVPNRSPWVHSASAHPLSSCFTSAGRAGVVASRSKSVRPSAASRSRTVPPTRYRRCPAAANRSRTGASSRSTGSNPAGITLVRARTGRWTRPASAPVRRRCPTR